ncbi:MAG: phosphoenolpyruvate carboxykinase, partial [Gammaproteobacteria bacterium]|nr:phosphoenolpyruvate carboxykinase [Gammaproteobacteria bacterium]
MIQLEEETMVNKKIFVNLSASELINMALTRNEGVLAANQALNVSTGVRTGRSPKDRFIVKDAVTEKVVDWNTTNQAIAPEIFKALWHRAEEYLNQKNCSFISYLKVGADTKYALTVKVVTELAWHNLFARTMFIHPDALNQPVINSDQSDQWQILCVPSFATDPVRDGVHSDAAIILNFSEKRLLICGTYYAGEMKKGMFSVLNFLLPNDNVLPMHCSANVGKDGKTALFFGLSGTGKTTLSADPARALIGDDEHGWSDEGVFNFEGGCYAKCIDLSQEREPMIWDAIRYGSIMENVVLDPKTKVPDYTNTSLTQNTRAAYPRDYISPRVDNNKAGQPNAVIFLTCDLYGVLPPVARLTKEQAAYYFLSGYTALVGSTEVGQGSGIKQTFSTCFGAPFFPRPAREYADLLMKRLDYSGAQVYLVNTGWTGGAHGQGGKRFSIPMTRAIIDAVVNGDLEQVEYEQIPGFNLAVPTQVKGVDSIVLNPIKTWSNPDEYNHFAKLLMQNFIDNFKKFTQVSDEIRKAGP